MRLLGRQVQHHHPGNGEIRRRAGRGTGHRHRHQAARLVHLAGKIRQIREQGLAEGSGTRLLIYAGQLIVSGIDPALACRTAIAQPLTDDPGLLETLDEIIGDIFA